MVGGNRNPITLTFDDYRLNVSALELRKHGVRITLRHQPLRVLAMLAARSGEMVTREELQRELWDAGTFVDFDRGLNNCVKQIRDALHDEPAEPKYIETIPRRGYRFIAQVDSVTGNGSGEGSYVAAPTAVPKTTGIASGEQQQALAVPRSRKFSALLWVTIIGTSVAVAAVAIWTLLGWPAFSFHERDWILISDFENHTGDPRFDDALSTAFKVSLEQSHSANVVPRARAESALKRMGKTGKERVTEDLGREICQRENVRGLIVSSITRTGQEYTLTSELIDPVSGAAVRSHIERVQGEDHILSALDSIASKIRFDLGESLYRIHNNTRPLPQVTTASLAALEKYANGQSLWQDGKFDEAVDVYRNAVGVDPDFAMAHAALGNAYCSHILNYQNERCAQEYQKALSLRARVTDRERRIIELGYTREFGRVEDADRLFRFYLADYPDDSAIHWKYARFLRLHDREAEAISQFKELLRISPKDAGAYIEIATAYKTLGRYPEAIDVYAKAFQLAPGTLNISNINREYGFTLVANGQEDKAEQVFSTLLNNSETRESGLQSLALLDLKHGRYTAGRKRFEEALSIADLKHDSFSVARNHYFLAVIAAGQGKPIVESQHLDAVISDFKNLGPKVEYGSLIGQEYARAGAVEKAEKIEKIIAPLAAPDNESQNGYLKLLRGEILLAKGNALDALTLFDLQDSRYGGSVESLSVEARARAYDQANKIDQAILDYEHLFGQNGCRLEGWEPQQRCEYARMKLASDYLGRGDRVKAAAALAPLLKDWQGGDSNLALKKQALELKSRLAN
jgi:eukaryotic-like serine/threonine-protein kinase